MIAASRPGLRTPPPTTATNEENLMTFREKLRFLREREGLTQYTLADELTLIRPGAKVYQNRVWQLENVPKSGNETKIEPSLLLKIAEFFNVPVHWLIDPKLGPDDLHTRPSEYDKLSEIDRQVLTLARVLGPQDTLTRLLHPIPADPAKSASDPISGLTAGPASDEVAPTLKKNKEDLLPKKPPPPAPDTKGKGQPGNGGASPDPKRPRRPKSRVKIAGTARNASLGVRMARAKKKLPGTSK